MTTTPSRLAKLASSSGSLPVARARARSLYRDWYRSAPEIVQLYSVSITPAAIRVKIRQIAEAHQHVEDLEAYDVLLHKWYQDYQETVNFWKQEPHIYSMFKDNLFPPKPKTFMDKFIAGRDEDLVQPSAR